MVVVSACTPPDSNDDAVGDESGSTESGSSGTGDEPGTETETGSETETGDETDTGTDTQTETGTDTQTGTGTETDTGEGLVVEISCLEKLQLPAGLSFHIAQGECSDGLCTWDYDPIGAEISQISGTYDHATGEFAWEVGYEPAHWRTATSVVGTALISPAGDESSTYVRTTLDVLGAELVETVALERVGCALERTTTDANNQAFVLQGELGADFVYTEEQIPKLWSGDFPTAAEGSRSPAGIVAETIFIPGPLDDIDFWWTYQHTLDGDADGNTSVSFSQWNAFSDWSREGSCDWDISGSESCAVTVDSEDWGAEVEWTVDYAGDGSGVFTAWFYNPQTMEFAPQDCPITFSNWSCSIGCPGGQTPNCNYFLMQ